jgi:hypothetical protein
MIYAIILIALAFILLMLNIMGYFPKKIKNCSGCQYKRQANDDDFECQADGNKCIYE